MKGFLHKRILKKSLVFGVLLAAMCLLTFSFVAPKTANATAVGVAASEEEKDEPVTATTSNEDTDTSGSNLLGNIGGLTFQYSNDGTSSLSATLQILLILTVIALAPSILIMLTSFTRVLIVLHFVRTALGTQTTPPNQVLIGLALFITVFIMSPVISKINTEAIQPLNRGEITNEEAFERGMAPVREFMFEQMENEKDLQLFLDIAGITDVQSRDDVPNSALIPAFILSELRIAFIIGFLIYIPFIIIDMVVASTLMSMGMMMLPPTTISMPFKILLFIVADGWDLVVGRVVATFFD